MDGLQRSGVVKPYMPKTVPFDLALRCDRDGNVPQVQFNEDGVWHDKLVSEAGGAFASCEVS